MAPRRFTNGISTVSSSDPLAQFPFVDPMTWRIWKEDFFTYDEAQTLTPTWTLTNTNTGGVDTIEPPGVLLLTLDGSNDDACALQAVHTRFYLTADKKAIFEAKIKIEKGSGTIGQEGFIVGLSEVETGTNIIDAPPPTALAMADVWAFYSYDNSTGINCVQGENDDLSTELAVGTYADDTWMVLSIYWDGSKSNFYKDGVKLCEITSNPPTSVVSPLMLISAGEATADMLYVDYFIMANER